MRKLLSVLLFLPLLMHAHVYAELTAENSNIRPMVYRYWNWGATKQIDNFQVAALELALKKTLSTHGPYEIIRVQETFTSTHAMREIQTGKILNLQAAPARSFNHKLAEVTRDTSIEIQIPLMQGLLGYRQLIVRKDQLSTFAHIKTAEQLKQLLAGQGKAWEDVYIYRQNDFRINDDGEYQSLANMLLAKRFDYLPMSILEAEQIITRAERPEELTIVPQLIIYYPLPLYFLVSKFHPELAERLESGLLLAQKDHSLEQLLRQHFGKEIAFLQENNNRIIRLMNPSVPEQLNLTQPVFTYHKNTPTNSFP